MNQPRMHWDAETGWVCDVSLALPATAVQAIVDYTLKVQCDRIRGMLNGDRKDQAIAATRQLIEQGWRCVTQNIIPRYHDSEKVIYTEPNKKR